MIINSGPKILDDEQVRLNGKDLFGKIPVSLLKDYRKYQALSEHFKRCLSVAQDVDEEARTLMTCIVEQMYDQMFDGPSRSKKCRLH